MTKEKQQQQPKRVGRPKREEKTKPFYSPLSVDAWNAIAKIAKRTGSTKREIVESAVLSFANANPVVPEPPKTDAAKIAAIREILSVEP